MTPETIVHLHPGSFGEVERRIVSHGELGAAAFRYPGGVVGLRLANSRGAIVVLPWQGQQVWDASFDGRTLTMKSMFDRPRPTREYLATYGAFLVHCGATAMGVPVPAKGDTHPLHGDLPNAPYDEAFVAAGTDARGSYLAVGGAYRHTVAFTCDYAARPLVKLYEGSAMLSVEIGIENLKRTPMDLMYLAHVNFRPLDGGRLVYSAPCTPKTVRVRTSIPSHVRPPAGYAEFLQELARDPSRHNVLSPGLAYDPEVVLYLDYLADGGGWSRSMMVHPDGYASCIRHRPSAARPRRPLDLPDRRPGLPRPRAARHGRARGVRGRESEGERRDARGRSLGPLRDRGGAAHARRGEGGGGGDRGDPRRGALKTKRPALGGRPEVHGESS